MAAARSASPAASAAPNSSRTDCTRSESVVSSIDSSRGVALVIVPRAWTRKAAAGQSFFRRRSGGRVKGSVPVHALVRLAASAAEAGGEDEHLGRILAAGPGLDVAHLLEVALQEGEKVALRPALQGLGEEGSAVGEHFGRELGRGLAERHDAEVIGGAVAGAGGGHVGEHGVGLAAEGGLHGVVGALREKVELQELDARKRVHLLHVDADDAALGTVRAAAVGVDLVDGDLEPAAGGAAEIDDALAGPEEGVPLLDLGQLVGGAAAHPLGPGALDVGVVELALQPAGGGELAALGGLDLGLEVPGAAARGE